MATDYSGGFQNDQFHGKGRYQSASGETWAGGVRCRGDDRARGSTPMARAPATLVSSPTGNTMAKACSPWPDGSAYQRPFLRVSTVARAR